MIAMIAFRPCINLITIWRPGVAHGYLYYHFLYIMVSNSFPLDFGDHRFAVYVAAAFEAITNFSMGHYGAKDFWGKILTFFVAFNYIYVIIPTYLLVPDKSMLERFVTTVVGTVLWIPTFAFFELTINWFF